MIIRFLKRQFRTRRRHDDGSPLPTVWVGDGQTATLINPDSGRVHAYVWHDGCGKYYPTVIVSPWRALHLVRREMAALVSLLSFPRCTVELYRLRASDMVAAQEYAEHELGYHD
jgi:hypothetical protein